MDLLESLKEEMSHTSLDQLEEQHDPSFEARLFSEDADCQAAGQPLSGFDLFAGTLLHPDRAVSGLREIVGEAGSDPEELLARIDPEVAEEPFCPEDEEEEEEDEDDDDERDLGGGIRYQAVNNLSVRERETRCLFGNS